MKSLLKDYGYSVWRKVRDRIAADAGWRCGYCRREVRQHASPDSYDLATIDHKVPLSRGRSWKRRNLMCACRGCNSDKGPLTDLEYAALIADGLAWFCRQTPAPERKRRRREMLHRCLEQPSIHPGALPLPKTSGAEMRT